MCGRMNCDVRVLNYASLAFGLISFGALSLAVATDFWLFTSEPLPIPPEYTNVSSDMSGFTVKMHSGLWRACIYYEDEQGAGPIPSSCHMIGYSQTFGRIEGVDTTTSILRAIRKAAPSIVVSVCILAFALGFSTVGNNKNNNKTVVGAILYTFSALSLAVGVIFYISAVNDEVSHRKPPTNPEEAQFKYNYGWAFFFAGSSFIFSLICAVTNISVYLKRYSNLDDMVIIIPGLDKRTKLIMSSSRDMDESDYDVGAQNPTIIL